tara:strand:- start:25 stop:558 length:534 start_codon:yes stop_codon:yes gene_type:complete
MACLKDSPHFDSTKNNYYTTKKMWENIIHLIPTDKIIYEAFLLNSQSKSINYLTELGLNVVGDTKLNFLTDTIPTYDIIISNPPFETKIKQKILKKLIEIDKPFIIILNCMNIYSKYMRDIFGENLKYLQQIIPSGKIKFEVFNEETKSMKCCKDPAFYSCYLAYKMNISNTDLWLK